MDIAICMYGIAIMMKFSFFKANARQLCKKGKIFAAVEVYPILSLRGIIKPQSSNYLRGTNVKSTPCN